MDSCNVSKCVVEDFHGHGWLLVGWLDCVLCCWLLLM